MDNSFNFEGLINEASICSAALSADRIRAQYRSGVAAGEGVPVPVITSISRGGNVTSLSFISTGGVTCLVESSPDLIKRQPVSDALPGNGGGLTVTDVSATGADGESRQFHRVTAGHPFALAMPGPK